MGLTALVGVVLVVAVAFAVAAAVEPVVEFLGRRGLSRRVGVATVFLGLAVPTVLAGWFLAPVAVGQISEFAQNPPPDLDPAVLNGAVAMGGTVGAVLSSLVLIPVLAVYISAALPGLLGRSPFLARTAPVLRRRVIDRALFGIAVGLVLGGVVALGAGVTPVGVGALAALLAVVPTVGVLAAGLLAVLACPVVVLPVLLLVLVGLFVERTVLRPVPQSVLVGGGLLVLVGLFVTVPDLGPVPALVGGGLLLALAVEPVVGRLTRYVPRPAAVLALLGTAGLVLWSASLVRGPDPFLRAGALLSDLERWLAASSVQDRLGTDVDLAGFAHSTLSGFTSTPDVLATVGISTWVPNALWVTVLAVAFSLLLPLLRFPADGARVVGRYAGGQVALAAINGVLTLVVALILGAPGPVVLAVWGFALAFVPLVGLWISGGLLVLACSATPESTWVAAIVVLVYLQLEAYVLAPLILARAVTLPAGVVIAVTAAGAAVGGLPGAVVAVPVVALAVSVERHGRLGRSRATGTLHMRSTRVGLSV